MKMSQAKKPRTRNSTPEVQREFDGEGVRRSVLAVLRAVYEKSPYVTLPQLLVVLEIVSAQRDGSPHTLVTLVKTLKMPFSTASRVVWSLTEEGGELGVVRYEPHPTDRRKKYLVVDPDNVGRDIPRAMTRAMVEYYGDTVKSLRRKSPPPPRVLRQPRRTAAKRAATGR